MMIIHIVYVSRSFSFYLIARQSFILQISLAVLKRGGGGAEGRGWGESAVSVNECDKRRERGWGRRLVIPVFGDSGTIVGFVIVGAKVLKPLSRICGVILLLLSGVTANAAAGGQGDGRALARLHV